MSSSDSFLQLDTKSLELAGAMLDIMNERKDKGCESISEYEMISSFFEKVSLIESFEEPRENNLLEATTKLDTRETAKTLVNFLSHIVKTMEQCISPTNGAALEHKSLRSTLALASLPDDILSIIIEYAALEYEPGFGALDLSHVCRNFRYIALHLPKIWTRLSNDVYGLEMTRLYAGRSKHAGLEVEMEESACPWESSSMLQAAIPFCSEWVSFSYTGFHRSDDPDHVKEHRIPLKLPRLTHLEVENDADGVYRAYHMPNLKSAFFKDTIPSSTFSSTISTISISFGSFNDTLTVDPKILASFLKATPSIRDLRLSIRGSFDPLEGEDTLLPNIEKFTVDVVYVDREAEGVDWMIVGSFLSHLVMPNVKDMDLTVRFTNTTDAFSRKDHHVLALLPDRDTHTKLTSLNLTIIDLRGERGNVRDPSTYEMDYMYNDTMVFYVDSAPFLTSLKLRTNFELSLIQEDDRPFIPLRRLELDYCPRLSDNFLEELAEGLKRDGNWEKFEEAIVRGCPGIKSDLRGKIRFVPVSRKETDPFGFEQPDLWM
ncbi:hypothetical protein SCHPADRAFT_938088 [Schizopora paradoxa]|uniref:F-box domain-containing protein n=1 Tax=Schizopora paradoxa TaxID=27342 RepID=A0A0H2RVU9_9AGAM|nr:hypothetical protein SCHPADRAFT_938088 [Schizopora paradoxa]